MSIEIKNYRPINKPPMVCGFSVVIKAWGGIEINDCLLMEKGDRSWINFPQRMYEKDGEKKYASYVYLPREVKDKLDVAIKAELVKYIEPEGPSVNDEEIPF